MKTTFIHLILMTVLVLSNTFTLTLNSQTISIDTIQNTPVGESFNDLYFQVGDSTVMKVAADGNIKINTNLEVPNGSIQTDSIRARVIHVGDSSLIIGLQPQNPTWPNLIRTTNTSNSTLFLAPHNGITSILEWGNILSSAANPRLGIGTGTPNYQLQLWRGTASTVVSQFTHSATSAASTDGFITGIDATGNAILYQQENLPMLFRTNNIERMRITQMGNVGIGTTSPDPTVKLHVLSSTSPDVLFNQGVLGQITASGSQLNVGVRGRTSAGLAAWNAGVIGEAEASDNASNVGVYGVACGENDFNYGGYFDAGCGQCSPSTMRPWNVGIFAKATGWELSPTVCAPGQAGWFQGFVWSSAGFSTPSDSILKDSIQNVSSEVLQVLAALQPKQFVFKRDSYPYMQLPVGKQYGFISQQLDTVIPELVHTVMQPPIFDSAGGNILMDTMRFESVNYTGLIPLLVAGVNELASIEANRPPIIGNYQPDPQNPITNNYEIPLNNHNYYFSGQGTNPDSNNIGSSVGIGLDCGDPIQYAKLHVRQSVLNAQDNASTAGLFENDAAGPTAVGGSYTVGVYATSFGEAFHNVGGSFNAISTQTAATQQATGVEGYATDALDINTGVKGEGYNGDYNYGVHGIADGGSNNYAIYGVAPGTFSNSWAGYFDGDIDVIGTIFNTSDAKFKTNIKDLNINNARAIISNLTPKSYQYKASDFPSMKLPTGNQYGLIAQEVETVLPDLVKDAVHPPKRDSLGKIIHPAVTFKAVNYTGFIPVLIGAVKEQQHTIDSLKEVINERLTLLENRLNGCCGIPHHYKTDPDEQNTKNVLDVALSNPQTIILDQNTPNPFAEKTVIGYSLPVDVQVAEIIFHNAEGKQINRTAINVRGNGEINVYAQDLSSGVYTYTLVADGNVIDTKRMVKK